MVTIKLPQLRASYCDNECTECNEIQYIDQYTRRAYRILKKKKKPFSFKISSRESLFWKNFEFNNTKLNSETKLALTD